MIYHLLELLQVKRIGLYAYEDVLFRAVLAALTGLAVAFKLGPFIIRRLMRMKIGDRPEFHHVDLNILMKDRANTPTLGGIIILAGILCGTLLWSRLNNPFMHKAVFIILWFGILGAIDDGLKLAAKNKKSRHGLFPREKLIAQLCGAFLVVLFLSFSVKNIEDAWQLWLPFYKYGIPLAGWVFVILATLYITATSNAVNFTDGMDGLASGCLVVVSAVLVILCYVASESMGRTSSMTWAGYLLLPQIPAAGELCVFYASIAGAILGFLWYNCRPAQVFMGDTGSLPLGAAMGYGAVVTRNEILLLLVGGVFVIELLSVILQVGYFKYTNGKRLFRIAPIHYHFQLGGWSEPQIVVRFWLLSLAFAVLALATLKIR